MVKARKLGALAPVVYCVEHEAATIYMEKVAGRSVKEAILSGSLDDAGEPRGTTQGSARSDAHVV